jgi:hypothetical protein
LDQGFIGEAPKPLCSEPLTRSHACAPTLSTHRENPAGAPCNAYKQTADTQAGIDWEQEKKTAMGTNIAALEVGNDFAGTQVLEKHGVGKTGCQRRAFFN